MLKKPKAVHLKSHLKKLPTDDVKSRTIVTQMKADEMQHGASAKEAGAAELPTAIKKLMTLHAKVMTFTAYWI